MYKVELDLVLTFEPPMDDKSDGIRVTRTIELPFPPSAEIAVFSKEWEGMDVPLGSPLKDITWDIDRSCFLAETHLGHAEVPIAMIPHELHYLIDNGWRFGSCRDIYETDGRRGRKRRQLPVMPIMTWDFEVAKAWDAGTAKSRPKEYVTVLHAVATTMARLRNNSSVAYAMMKSGGFVEIPEHCIDDSLTPFQRKFKKAKDHFESMTFHQQWDWCDEIQKRHPRLADVVEAMQ